MAQRNVVWTRTADIQFTGILQYWVNRNKSNLYSKKLMKSVIERTNLIAEKPLTFKRTDFDKVRISTLNNFSIFYKISDSHIIITAFWDNRQDPKKLLKILENNK